MGPRSARALNGNKRAPQSAPRGARTKLVAFCAKTWRPLRADRTILHYIIVLLLHAEEGNALRWCAHRLNNFTTFLLRLTIKMSANDFTPSEHKNVFDHFAEIL
ncbi:unnamed protein product [Arctia plantaginis]|uniref:Uncharacterized protein n=1 Tax=Arctia plantaginis TaxID=874455 RepID=A0A8S0YL37_ARCPL|nr:unnamed protein product [Arctia plantaginis]CAB3236387.1 unnamed protein product [Arctia plantaginis]